MLAVLAAKTEEQAREESLASELREEKERLRLKCTEVEKLKQVIGEMTSTLQRDLNAVRNFSVPPTPAKGLVSRPKAGAGTPTREEQELRRQHRAHQR